MNFLSNDLYSDISFLFFMLSFSSFLIMAYSQSGEYVEFLQEICVSSGNCNSNETPTFISLAVNVQVEFVWLLCPNKKQSCYEHYLNLPDLEQIKFNVSNFDENMLDERVQKFCTRLWRVTVEYHGGTSGEQKKKSTLIQYSTRKSKHYY